MVKNKTLKKAIIDDGRWAYQVANAIGVSESRLSRMITGRARPSTEEADGLARELGTSKAVLFPEYF